MKGLREGELVKLGNCIMCGKKLLAGKLPLFYRVRVERHCFKAKELQRRAGLEQMLGGAGALAAVLGPDEELTTQLPNADDVVMHEECAPPLVQLWYGRSQENG